MRLRLCGWLVLGRCTTASATVSQQGMPSHSPREASNAASAGVRGRERARRLGAVEAAPRALAGQTRPRGGGKGPGGLRARGRLACECLRGLGGGAVSSRRLQAPLRRLQEGLPVRRAGSGTLAAPCPPRLPRTQRMRLTCPGRKHKAAHVRPLGHQVCLRHSCLTHQRARRCKLCRVAAGLEPQRRRHGERPDAKEVGAQGAPLEEGGAQPVVREGHVAPPRLVHARIAAGRVRRARHGSQAHSSSRWHGRLSPGTAFGGTCELPSARSNNGAAAPSCFGRCRAG